MHVVIVYESMFGNTRQIAEAIGAGLGAATSVRCVPVALYDPRTMADADLLVVGAPTHAWSLSRAATRRSAADQAARSDGALALEPAATGAGVREWLDGGPDLPPRAAVFDTRRNVKPLFSGRASRTVTHLLKGRGITIVGSPRSFLVDVDNKLVPGQIEQARTWGHELGRTLQPVSLRGHSDELLP